MRLVSTKDAPRTIVTTNGIEVPIRAVSQSLIQMAYASVKFPDPPTYTISLPNGGTQVFTHDEKSIEQTPADKPAWDEYKRLLIEANNAQQRKTLELFILQGTDLELPADDKWERTQRRLGVEIPNDEVDRLIHWALTEILVTLDDQIALYTGVMKLVGLPQEEVDNIEAIFRGGMGQGAESDTTEKSEGGPGAVVAQPVLLGGTDGQIVGAQEASDIL